MRRLGLISRPIRTWALQALVRFVKFMPAALDRAHLEWAQREIDPMHPDVGYIARRLSELEDVLNGPATRSN